jgi:hypothetical protein
VEGNVAAMSASPPKADIVKRHWHAITLLIATVVVNLRSIRVLTLKYAVEEYWEGISHDLMSILLTSIAILLPPNIAVGLAAVALLQNSARTLWIVVPAVICVFLLSTTATYLLVLVNQNLAK